MNETSIRHFQTAIEKHAAGKSTEASEFKIKGLLELAIETQKPDAKSIAQFRTAIGHHANGRVTEALEHTLIGLRELATELQTSRKPSGD